MAAVGKPTSTFTSRLSRALVAAFVAIAALLITMTPAVAVDPYPPPSGLSASLTSTAPGTSVGSTVSYTSGSTWADTDVVITFEGWTANSTFNHQAPTGACDPTVTVVTAASSSMTFCTWAQVGANAVLTMQLRSGGLAGSVSITLASGMLTNPGVPGTYAVTASEVWSGSALSQTFQIREAASGTTSTLTPSSASITADGTASQVLTVQAKYANGTSLSTDAATVTITRMSGVGSVGAVAYGGSGTYVATVTSTTAGSGVFIATADGSAVKSGQATQTESTITFTAGPATAVRIDAGDGQSGPVGSGVAIPPRVLVVDATGNPVAGVAITFAVASGGGVVDPATAITTGADGRAGVASWTLGPGAGTNTLTATATGVGGSPSVTFTALATVSPPPPPAPAPSSTPTPTPTPTPTASATALPTLSPSPVPSPAPTAAATAKPSPSRKPSASHSASPRPSPPASASASASPSPTPSPSPSPVADEATESATADPSRGSPPPQPAGSAAADVVAPDLPTPSPAPEVPTPAPSTPPPPPVALFTDTAVFGPALRLAVNLSLGASVTGRAVTLDAVGLRPGTPVVVLLHSEPQVIGEGVADEQGASAVQTQIPANLEVGTHTVTASGTGPDGQPVQAVGAFMIDADQVATAIAPPGQSVMPVAPGSPELERALAAGKPIYDPGLYPATTAAVAVAAIALLGLAGLGGMTAPGGGGEPAEKTARGKLAGVVTKKLKAGKVEEEGRGDRSRMWRAPLTARTDAGIAAAPVRAGHWSAMVPRVLVDGAWSRAMFGSLGFSLWITGFALGVWSAVSVGFNAFPPALPLALAIIVLGVLDSSAGAIAWLTITIAAVATGHVTAWTDVRTLLGMFVLFASLPLLAHAIRPLRRKASTETKDRFDRVADYVMMPIFVAFAASSMFKALNGLSGLELTNPDQLWAVRIAVILACWLRLALEDVATHAFPVRSTQVQPVKLVSPGRGMALVSVAIRTGIFILVAAPFFGLGWITWLAAVLLAIPMLLKIWEDSLPNSPQVNKWFPRGLARFVLLLVVGIYLAAWLLGHSAPDEQVRATYNLLLLPGIVSGVIEIFGREGGDWPDSWLKRAAGGLLWLFAASVTVGLIALG